MKISQLLKFILTIHLSIFSLLTKAQSTYKYRAPIPNVSITGFYRIVLPPAVVGKCQNSLLTDMRILNNLNQEVPYLSQQNLPNKYKGKFIKFHKLSPNTDTTAILFKMAKKAPVKQMYLLIKDNKVDSEINLSGSDDGVIWRTIDQNIPLTNPQINIKGNFEYLLTFPISSYKYYCISFCKRNKKLIEILDAGYYKTDLLEGNYDRLPNPVITQQDSSGTSFVKINLKESYIPDKLHLDIKGTKPYLRDVGFYTIQRETTNTVSGHEWGMGIIMSDTIDSKKSGDFYPGITSFALFLEIQNNDDPPLKITSAKVYQARQSVICYLEAGHTYNLIFGNLYANDPAYDPYLLKNNTINQLKTITVGPIIQQRTEH